MSNLQKQNIQESYFLDTVLDIIYSQKLQDIIVYKGNNTLAYKNIIISTANSNTQMNGVVKKITDIFDMFIGTSAGAFNASCLAFDDMSMMDLKNYWSKEYLDRIMETSFFWDQASLIQARPRYETKGRLKFLNEIFGEKTLGESKKPLVTLCT